MATFQPPKINTEFIFFLSVVSQADTKLMQSSATIAAGDFQVSTDGGTLGNLSTLPVVTPASSAMIKITLSTSEMNGDNITLVCSDAAGAEWCDLTVNLQTAANQIDDIKTDTAAIKTKTDFLPSATAGAAGGVFIAGTNAATTVTTSFTTTFTGDLTGSVASVTADVGITQAGADKAWSTTTRILTASTNFNDISAADVNAQVVDVLFTDTITLIGQAAPSNTPTIASAMGYVYKMGRNRTLQTATLWSLFADDGTTTDQTAVVSDDGTTAETAEVIAGT